MNWPCYFFWKLIIQDILNINQIIFSNIDCDIIDFEVDEVIMQERFQG